MPKQITTIWDLLIKQELNRFIWNPSKSSHWSVSSTFEILYLNFYGRFPISVFRAMRQYMFLHYSTTRSLKYHHYCNCFAACSSPFPLSLWLLFVRIVFVSKYLNDSSWELYNSMAFSLPLPSRIEFNGIIVAMMQFSHKRVTVYGR